MSRSDLSRPVAQALDDGVLTTDSSFFDYGCGRGSDVRQLRAAGLAASGWDPAFAPDAEVHPAEIVNLGYVINVIEDPLERVEALRSAWDLAESVLVVAARMGWEADSVAGRPHGDGLVTSKGTFQKFYAQDELRAWIDGVLSVRSVAAAPGIFYIFRDDRARQRMLAAASRRAGGDRRRAIAQLIFERHEAVLEPLAEWVADHGTLPSAPDLPSAEILIGEFGSVRSAFTIIRRATGKFQDLDLGPSRKSEQRFEQNLELLQPLIDFVSERGRLPKPEELENSKELGEEFGSIRAAFSLIRRVTGAERWTEHEAVARESFLVFLALSTLQGRPRFSDLPFDLQYDVRDFFGSFKSAAAVADELLYSVGDVERISDISAASSVGKLTPEALYVHVSALGQLPAELRVYEGCARALSGTVRNATLVKMHRLKSQVSYLIYPEFDRKAHPALLASVIVRLPQLRVDYRGFGDSPNPPILHRKETFVAPDYPGYERFARLTAQEERAGLLDRPDIGRVEGWETALEEAGRELHGHRLLRRQHGATRI